MKEKRIFKIVNNKRHYYKNNNKLIFNKDIDNIFFLKTANLR